DLRAAVERAAAAPAVRVIVVRGAGAAFCAGLDLAELAAQRAGGAVETHTLEHALEVLERCPQPTLAAVQGDAIAGGCELALHCDLRVAADNARFTMPLARIRLAVPVAARRPGGARTTGAGELGPARGPHRPARAAGAPVQRRVVVSLSKEERRAHLHREGHVALEPRDPLQESSLRRQLAALQPSGVIGPERDGATRARRVRRAKLDEDASLAVVGDQPELERPFQSGEPRDPCPGEVARAGRSTHAETGPGERLPVGTALRKADEWGPGRRALDAHVLAVDVHEPGASAVALEHEFQGCLRRQAVLQLPLEAGDLRAQVRDSLAQAVRDVLSQEGRRLEGRRTLSHWQPQAEPGARRDR